ncbi:MAG: radical SAM/SPASM domain-containing protein [Candidatus Heimdallarchaeaceae archaeon]
MKDEIYSPFKIAHHKKKLYHLSKGRLIMPVFIQWDLTNKCNNNCSFCFYKINPLTDWNKNDEMPTDIVFRVLEELKELGIKAIEWTGGGEPTLHPDHKEIFKRAKKLGFEQALVTNGTLLDEKTLQIIKDFEWVRFSVDAATAETYRAIKSTDLFDVVIRNLRRLIRIHEENCIIGFSFIVCPDNYREILMATKMAKALGCDNIRFSLAMTPSKEKLFENIWDECLDELELAKSEETEYFKVFEFSNRINVLAKDVLSDYCGYHHFVGVIAPRGVYPCCRLKDDATFNFGSLEKHTFKEIWKGKKRRRFIESIKNGCPYDCWMTEKNKFIKYLITKDVKHVNFI